MEDKNISHTVVDPKFRRLGLARAFKKEIMQKLNLPFLTLTINLSNTFSIESAKGNENIKKVSDENFERESGKVKYLLQNEFYKKEN